MSDRPDVTGFKIPCRDPQRADDWHIPERQPLSPEEEQDIRTLAATEAQMEHGDKCTPELEQKAGDRAVSEAITDLKARRRNAISSCYYDCPMGARQICLQLGLEPINLEFGIWGGYPESDRRQIADAIAERKKTMTTGAAAKIILSAETKEALNPS